MSSSMSDNDVEDVLDDLPIHYQVVGIRADAAAVYLRLCSVSSEAELHPSGDVAKLGKPSMPMTITITRHGSHGKSRSTDSDTWATNFADITAPVKLRLLEEIELETLQGVVSQKNIQSIEIAVFGDATIQLLASFVRLKKFEVKRIKLVIGQRGEPTISAEEFKNLLDALCKVPKSSKLEVFEIPEDARKTITGDPFFLADAINKCRGNSTAARILKLEHAEIAPPAIAKIDAKDSLTLWLPSLGNKKFCKEVAVEFPRKRLLASSKMLQLLLEDNPKETCVELPLHTLEQRSVSLKALTIAAQLVQHHPVIKSEPINNQRELVCDEGHPLVMNRDNSDTWYCSDCGDAYRKRMSLHCSECDYYLCSSCVPTEIVWTAEFQEVYEAAFLPILEPSDIPAFRRQLALKLFGEILELGRYLELRVAYEFGLIGGVAMFARRLDVK